MKQQIVLIVIFILMNCGSPYAQSTVDLDTGLSQLADQLVANAPEGAKKKVAVIEFCDLDGQIRELGKYISEDLTTQFFISQKFNVIERQLLNTILAEHKLTITGVIDESTAKQLGSILGVDAICTGTITELANSYKIYARLISTDTGAIINAGAVKVDQDEDTRKLWEVIKMVTPKISARSAKAVSESISEEEQDALIAELKRGLIAYYPFSGNANDESGNGNGLIVNGAALIANRFGVEKSAYSLDGDDWFVSGMMSFGTQYTVALWYKRGTNNTVNGCLFHHGRASKCFYEPTIWVGNSNTISPKVSGCGNSGMFATITTDPNKWEFLVVVVSGSSQRIFLNGKQMAFGKKPSRNGSGRIFLGTSSEDGNNPHHSFSKGYIDDISIYNRQLTEKEINYLYHEGGWDE